MLTAEQQQAAWMGPFFKWSDLARPVSLRDRSFGRIGLVWPEEKEQLKSLLRDYTNPRIDGVGHDVERLWNRYTAL